MDNLFTRKAWLRDHPSGLYLPPRKVLRPERYLIPGVVAGGTGGPAPNNIVVIQGGKSQSIAAVASKSVGTFTFTAGNTLFACLSLYCTSPGAFTITDDAGNSASYVRDTHLETGGNPDSFSGEGVQIWRCSNCLAGAPGRSITVHCAGTSFINVAFLEVQGLAASPVDTASAGDSGSSGTTNDTGAWTTTNANDLLLAVCGNDGAGGLTPTAPTGFTAFGFFNTFENGDAAYKVVSAIQTGINPGWTGWGTGDWVGRGAAYKSS